MTIVALASSLATTVSSRMYSFTLPHTPRALTHCRMEPGSHLKSRSTAPARLARRTLKLSPNGANLRSGVVGLTWALSDVSFHTRQIVGDCKSQHLLENGRHVSFSLHRPLRTEK